MEEETLFAKWQEDARKDVERAFCNLQSKFQVTCHPKLQHDLNQIADTFIACLIMYNIVCQIGSWKVMFMQDTILLIF
jgi:Plant transposon protein.